MKLNIYANYDCTYVLDKHSQNERSPYGVIELTEDEYFAFEKCEIEFLAWQIKIAEMLK